MNTYAITKTPFVPVAKTGEFANPYLIGNTANSTSSGSGSTSASGTLTVKDLLATDSPDTYKVLIQKTDGTFYSHPNLKAVHNEANKVSLYADAFLGGFTQAKDVLLTDQKQSGGDTEYNILFAQPVSTNGIYTIYYTANLNGEQNKLTYNSREGIMSAKNFAGDGSRLTNLTWDNITGKPTIPLNAVLATETYVNTQIAAIVNSAPETLDTLNELATALGGDANFATTVTNQIAGKAPLVHTHTISSITDIANASVASASKLTTARTISLSGNVTGSVSTDFSNNPTITTSISDTVVNSKLLTNYAVGSNAALAATDSIVGAFGKIQGQINNLVTLGTSQTISGLKNFTTAPTINSYAIWHSGNSNLSTIDWTAKDLTAAGNTKSSTYTGTGFTASGWQIDNAGNANVKSLTVRELARFYELEINKIRATNGALAVTDAAVITSVNGSVLSFDDIPPFQVGDVVRAQRWNGGARGFTASVTAVDTTNKTITVGSFTVGDATQIKAGDTVIRWNSSNASRKGLIYLTSSDTGSPNQQIIYDNVVKGQFGNLEGRLFNGVTLPANTYGVWINDGYFSGSVNVTGGNAETTTGSQSKADSAKTAAINAASTDAAAKVKALSDTLGTLATKSIVEASMLGTTIISGGYIKSSLLDVNTIIVNGGIAKTTDVVTAKSEAISSAASDATNKANTAKSDAITTAGTNADTKINTFKATLGSLAYQSAVSSAMLDSTIISGGYIKTSLLDVSSIIVGLATTNDVTTAKNSAISTAASDATSKASTAQTNAQNFTTNTIGNKFTYINGYGIYTGTLTANQVNAVGVTALGNVTAGSFNIGSGRFVVDSSGNLTSSNANITGTINATSGTIGGFSIYDTYMRSEDANWGWFTLDTRRGVYWHGYNNQLGKHFEIGGGTPPISYRDDGAIGYFRSNSTTSGLSSRTAIYAIAENGTYNTAIQAKGNIVTNGALYATGVNYYVASISTLNTSCKNGDTLLINCTYSGSNVYMPTLSDIRDVLGISSTDNFRVRITVNNKYNSPYGFYLYPGSNWGSYFRDWNGSNISNYLLNKGDSLMFDCYYYDGSAWIQTINNQA